MSGIVGVVRTDGAPVSAALIRELTESLTFRGPDATGVWNSGPVALGHTLLRTTYESEREKQPFTGDAVYVVADARIDARAELIRTLDTGSSFDSLGMSESELRRAPDVELILCAYLKWGEECVSHLLGDFAFAIWDGRRRRLFCARDHMGVKPFYYAHVGPWLVFSNTLDCVRKHPAVSYRLNDLAVADFLLFGHNQDNTGTIYRDIRRLPPAHTLTYESEQFARRRYWTLPIDEPVYYKRDRDYVERFDELLLQAVTDRLRVDRVSVLMSGGLDSTTMAATASRVLRNGTAPHPVRAFTYVYDSLIPDPERTYAEAAAGHLGVPIHFCVQDERIAWTQPGDHNTPEPADGVTNRRPEWQLYSDMQAHSRVAFFGEGPDNALQYEWQPHLRHLFTTGRWARLAVDVTRHVWSHKRIPLLPTIPRMIRERTAEEQYAPVFPVWLNSELVTRLDLRERWRQVYAGPVSRHPVRPGGYASMLIPLWQSVFESLEPPYTRAAIEMRHPYVDIRLLRFMLSAPALPWCRRKYILRCAARGVLPESVRSRSKTPLNGDPECEQMRRQGMPPVFPSEALARYAEPTRMYESSVRTVTSVRSDLLLVAFSYWLRDHESASRSQTKGERYEIRNEVVGSGR